MDHERVTQYERVMGNDRVMGDDKRWVGAVLCWWYVVCGIERCVGDIGASEEEVWGLVCRVLCRR